MKSKEELELIKKEYEDICKKLVSLNNDEMKNIVGGIKDTYIEDESVPVKEMETCPRCKKGVMIIATDSYGPQCKAEFLLCNICSYQYTPPEWKTKPPY